LFTSLDISEFVVAGVLAVAGLSLSIVAIWPTHPRRLALCVASVALVSAGLVVGCLPFVALGLPLPALLAIAAFFALVQLRSFGVFVARRPPT
jgi:hypothetical protein